MTVEYRHSDETNTSVSVVMTHCPFCGESFGKHGGNGRVHHLTQCSEAKEAREVNYE